MKIIANYPAYQVIDTEQEVLDVTLESSKEQKFCVAYESKNHGTLHSEVSLSCVDYYTREKMAETMRRCKPRSSALKKIVTNCTGSATAAPR